MSETSIMVVTAEHVPGYRVRRVLGIVSGSSARAHGVGRDLVAGIRNLIGGQVKEYKELAAVSRDEALREMAEKAREMGANAVIGARMATTMITQGVAEIVWYGTAVIVEPAE
jgi:uncharacterized protein YbjQ (UPF0145 family)